MDARNESAGWSERSATRSDRLGQIADLVGLPVEAFFGEADTTDLQELLTLWDVAGDDARSEILACARAFAARSRNGGA